LNLWSAIVLGIIQGLTEFIPVSSTAHLIIAPELLPNIATPTDPHAFDTIIQAGTLIPALLYFRKDWLELLAGAWRIIVNRRIGRDPHERLALLVLIGTIPACVLGLLVNKRVEKIADVHANPVGYLVIGMSLVVVGVLMWWIDAVSRKKRTIEQLTEVDAVAIGLGQAVALIPGVSRSGATITTGLMTGLTREAAARFSFILYAPVMLAATGFKALQVLHSHAAMPKSEWFDLFVGMIAAAIIGYLCIAFLLNYLRRHSLGVFAAYRVFVGLFLIGLWWYQHRG
jgi:undecaprenyl-diphosphatase